MSSCHKANYLSQLESMQNKEGQRKCLILNVGLNPATQGNKESNETEIVINTLNR